MEIRKTGVVIYGIGDEKCGYAVLRYWRMFQEDVSIREIDRCVHYMMAERPDVKQIFVIDNYHGLRRDFHEAKRVNSYTGWIIFRDILERQGVEWPIRGSI